MTIPSAPSLDETAIRTLVRTWLDASMRGDTDAVLALMTDDVVFSVVGREPFGKAEFAAASASMKDMQLEGTSDIQELTVHGDFAWLRSHLRMTITLPGGAKMTRAGYTLTILRKDEGVWRIARDANMLVKEENGSV